MRPTPTGSASSASTDLPAIRGVLDTVPIGIVFFGRNGVSSFANRGARDLLGELAAASLDDWVASRKFRTPDGAPVTGANLPPCQTLTGRVSRREVELDLQRHGESSVPLLMSSEPVLDPTGELLDVLCILVPIREYMQREDLRRRELRLETLGLLADNVAGPFNDAFTAIAGYCELASQRVPPSDPVYQVLDEIRQAGERAATLTRRILSHGGREVISIRPFELDAWLRDQVPALHAQLGDHVHLVVQPLAPKAWVNGDPRLLEQVLADMTSNARDVMPKGGELTIRTGTVDLDAGASTLQGARGPGPYAVLSVSDTGPGLNERLLHRIFDPFFTEKENALGLGLTTIERLVGKLGGHVRVETRRGEGSTFHVHLPRIKQESMEVDLRPLLPGASPDSDHRTAGTVLLVEDDVIVRDLVRQILEMRRFRVLEAFSAAEAMRVVEREDGRIDLLVTDVVLPGEGGPSLARRLREAIPGLRVLLVSGCSNERILRPLLDDEYMTFLPKPFEPTALLDTVNALLVAPKAETAVADEVGGDA
ncbi:MAG: response regulator [Planctomycetota bacterium]|jgi:signal transduction histidine kinase/CheY-like chemotaxis protein